MATQGLRWEDEALSSTTTRHRLFEGTGPVSWRGFAAGLRAEGPGLREALTAALAGSPHAALYWETPGVTAATADGAFEMVTLAAPGLLGHRARPDAFAAQLGGAGEDVRRFANLGGDAVLVVPRPLGPREAYAHLATFVRGAPRSQVDALWRGVGAALDEWWTTRPAATVWLSTSGGGVPWLHVRLDSRPKYYSHAPYRDES